MIKNSWERVVKGGITLTGKFVAQSATAIAFDINHGLTRQH